MKSYNHLRILVLKAVEADDSEALKKLLDRGVDPYETFDFKDHYKSVISLCAEMDRMALVKMLLRAGGSIKRMNGDGWTPLHAAVESGNEKMVALLLSKGAEVNQGTSMERETPLHLAAGGLNLGVVRRLIAAGADVKRRNWVNMTPLVHACTKPSLSMVLFLFELLKAKSCVDSRDRDGCTALHYIVRGNRFGDNAEAIELLLSYPCDVDAKDDLSQTPLYVAARYNNRIAVLLLLKAGCRVDIEGRRRYVETYSVKWNPGVVNLTPVDIALLVKFYDIAELLLAAGTRINRELWIALRETLEDGDPSMLERLLAVGADRAVCPKLYDMCRRPFYDCYGTETPRLIDKLPLPPLIKRYLSFEIL